MRTEFSSSWARQRSTQVGGCCLSDFECERIASYAQLFDFACRTSTRNLLFMSPALRQLPIDVRQRLAPRPSGATSHHSMTGKTKTKKYFTSLEAAALLMVSPVTVREWARKGLLPSVSTAGGHRRFLPDGLQQFASQHGIRLEAEPLEARAEPQRILLVDDDPVFAEYLREIVVEADPTARVECAADGFQAGQLTETLRPHLVVIDINMPGIDGIELCRRLRANPTTARARLMVLSGVLSDRNSAAARAAGADACLEKSATAADIVHALHISGRVARSRSRSDS